MAVYFRKRKMISTLFSFLALFASVFMLLMGNGLLGTLLSLRMTSQGFSAQLTGFIMASYFAGLVAGSLCCHRLIQRVGHIRAFAAFAAVATAAVMLHGIFISAPVWSLLRFFTGIATIGLYMVIESWLNECSTPKSRGRVFSMYMICTYLGMGCGQLLLNVGNPQSQQPFFIVGMLLALCLVPVTISASVHPELPEAGSISIRRVLQKAPLGILGCLLSGFITASFYAMGPVFCRQIGLDVSAVSVFMTVTILGGLLFQVPVGFLSDRVDRSLMLPAIGFMVSLISIAMIFIAGKSYLLLLIMMGIFGGFVFTIYPVAVARTHDLFESRDIMAVSSVLLFIYGSGACIGPVAASGCMEILHSPSGMFVFCSLVSALYACAGLFLRKKEILSIIPVEEQVEFVPMRQTSPVATAMDPRIDPEVFENDSERDE